MLATHALLSLCAAPAAAFPMDDPWTSALESKLLHVNPKPNDRLGWTVAVDGDTAVVGVPFDKTAGLTSSGSVWVFVRTGTTWSAQQQLLASDAEAGDTFGLSVAISGDTILVGTPDGGSTPGAPGLEGSAYVFTRSGTTWAEEAKLGDCDGEPCSDFGWSVGVSGDTAVIGDPTSGGASEGRAQVFVRNGTTWTKQADLVSATPALRDYLGWSVAIDGETIVLGAPTYSGSWQNSTTGEAHVFTRSGTLWSVQAVLTPGNGNVDDEFGWAVDVSGDRILVGAPLTDRGVGTFGEVRALGHDPATGELIGVDTSLTQPISTLSHPRAAKIAFDGPTSSATVLSTLGIEIEGLAVDPASDTQYGTSNFNQLVILNPAVGSYSNLGPIGFTTVKGLAFDPNTNTLYGSDTSSDLLLEIDHIFTGDGTPIGPLGFGAVRGLAFDPGTNTLYGADKATGMLITIDTSSGAGTTVGPLGFTEVGGLAFDSSTSTLYGTDIVSGLLYTIDTATGAGTPVGPVTGPAVSTGSAYVFERSGTTWIEVAELTASDAELGDSFGSAVALDGDNAVVGAWMAEKGTLEDAGAAYVFADGASGWSQKLTLSANDALADALFGMSVGLSADTVLVGASLDDPSIQEDAGSSYAYLLTGPIGTYCTAGISASGCAALLSSSGTPSASAPSGFALSATGVEGAKDGLFFFGANGRQANSWGNGSSYQCVVPPVSRAGLLAGNGTSGLCDGVLTQDLNALWCATCPKPGKNPGAGAVVQAQLWYRDPLSTSNQTTGLSDAIEFCLAP